MELVAFALVDLTVVGADAHRRRIDPYLEPVAGNHGAVLEDGWHAELHRLAVVGFKRTALELREEVPDHAAQQLVARRLREAQHRLVDVHVAVLPVQGDEGLVDLFEHGADTDVVPADVVAEVRSDETVAQRGRLATRPSPSCHAHLKAAVQAQLEGVHEGSDDEQPTAVVRSGVRCESRVEARHVEAPAVVFDRGNQLRVSEVQGDLDVVG